jgi:mannosyltransferase
VTNDGNRDTHLPQVVVTNFEHEFSGVSATIANTLPIQAADSGPDIGLLGGDLGLGDAVRRVKWREVLAHGWQKPGHKPFTIWHVRRNLEMEWAIFARDILKMPIKIVFTSASKRRHSRRPRWLIDHMDAVIAATDQAASFVPNVYAVVPHGIDTRKFIPASDRGTAWNALGWPGEIGIGMFGRIRPNKGSDIFVEALCRALPQFPSVTALINGIVTRKNRRFAQGLRDKVTAAGLAERVIWSDVTDYRKIIERYQGISLMVACPRREEFGLTPMEAMACGTPTLLSDTGDFRNMTVTGETGFIVPTGDIDALAARLGEMLTDPSRLETMGKAARTKAERDHDVHREVAGINAVYDRLWAPE